MGQTTDGGRTDCRKAGEPVTRPQSVAHLARAAGLRPGTVHARIRAGWPADALYAPLGTRYHLPAPTRTPANPALWERLEAARAAAGVSAAALSLALGHQRAWWSQQRAARHDLPEHEIERIEAELSAQAAAAIKRASKAL